MVLSGLCCLPCVCVFFSLEVVFRELKVEYKTFFAFVHSVKEQKTDWHKTSDSAAKIRQYFLFVFAETFSPHLRCCFLSCVAMTKTQNIWQFVSATKEKTNAKRIHL